MTKLLSAKELLEVVRTAQVDAQATGGGAKWPPRMAVGGRSGPRRRAMERARERDAEHIARPPETVAERSSTRPRGGTVPVMAAVSAPSPARNVAPAPPGPPPPGQEAARPPPARHNTAPSGATPAAVAAALAASHASPAAPAAAGGADALPPASAILAAMRAGRGGLPPPREPDPIPPSNDRIEAPPRPPSLSGLQAVQPEPSRRAPTHPEPISVRAPAPPESDEGQPSAARSLAALFPPARAPAPSNPAAGPPSGPKPSSSSSSQTVSNREPVPQPRGALPTMPEAPVALANLAPSAEQGSQSAPPPRRPIAREEPDEAPPSSTVPLSLPDLAVEVLRAPPELASTSAPAGKRENTSPAAAFAALGRLSATRESAHPAALPGAAATAAASTPMDVSWATAKPAWAPESAPIELPADEDEGSGPVALSTDETIVLLNYDAQASLEALSAKTGFSVFKVERIVERLMEQGVFEDLPSAPEAPKAKMKPTARDSKPPPGQPLHGDDTLDSLEGPPTEVDPRKRGNGEAGVEEEEAAVEDDEENFEETEQKDREDEEPEPESQREDEPETAQKDAELEANYRKLYETKLSRLDLDVRMKLAELGTGPDLFALAFDKDPQISRALFDNPHFNVDHARFAAFHHPTSFGIDRLATHNEFVKDPQVQRKLMRNPHTPELVVKRILSPKRLLEVYKVTNDRDVPDRQRMVARGTLRQKFTVAEPEDRLQLLWNTEGRCLTLLSGCPIDSKTTALFCARPVVSLMMVQNFAKYGATPPGLLSHFLKQNLVRRQVPLRNMLLKHPNCPSEAKKGY